MPALYITAIEDHEDSGRCQTCGREGLRWICRLSDGTGVGLECSKKVLGFVPKPTNYNWMTGYKPIAQHADKWQTFTLYQNDKGRTVMTENGRPIAVGNGRAHYERMFGPVTPPGRETGWTNSFLKV